MHRALPWPASAALILAVWGTWTGAGGGGSSPPPPRGAKERPEGATSHAREVDAWHARRIARLQSPDGWLSLVGLHWLEPGTQRFGSAPDNEVVLAAGAPAHAGALHVGPAGVRVTALPGTVTIEGEPVTERLLEGDDQEAPDVMQVGRLRLTAIRRGERWAIRARDPESPVRRSFAGIDRWPVSERWRIVARWEPYDRPRSVEVPTVLGTTERMDAPGVARFEVNGTEHVLEPVLEDPGADQLFFIFRDLTSGRTSYGAGRFLYTDLPRDGNVVLDFNRAYNPPCAFTPYATCPLPPPGNRLRVAVEAGEKTFGSH